MNKEIAVLIPALNEEKAIGGLVSGLKERFETVVVVDDGSSDNTARCAESHGAVVLRHSECRGKGQALKTGFKYIAEKGIPALITIDGDGQHSLADLESFENAYKKNKRADLWVGKRKIRGTKMPVIRRLTNVSMSCLISLFSGQWIPDTQCGFRLIKTKVIKNIRLFTSNFETESELLIKSGWKRYKISSVTVSTVYSDEKSKINPVRDTLRFFKMLAMILFPLATRIKKCKQKTTLRR